jgi:hypothetical protein
VVLPDNPNRPKCCLPAESVGYTTVPLLLAYISHPSKPKDEDHSVSGRNMMGIVHRAEVRVMMVMMLFKIMIIIQSVSAMRWFRNSC